MSGYDYIVVGGGSAGCVLANRLSREHRVLLLEAGTPDKKRAVSIPIAWVKLLRSAYDWGFQTVPQQELAGRTMSLPQGRVVGGSSSINAQLYLRGNPSDFDRWAEAGNDGWDAESVVEYFDRLEDGPQPALGTGGPQHIVEQDDPHPLSTAFVEAAVASGLDRRRYFDAADEGVGYSYVTQKGNRRHSAADAYLKPVLDRRTLTLKTGAEVRRVSFDGTRATGVTYVRDGEQNHATASGEVVLSAGAFNSPRLLLLSGVGPEAHLREHDIDVRVDRPGVGRNLQDHLITWIAFDCRTGTTYDDAASVRNLLNYLLFKRGPFTTNGAEAGAYWRSDPSLDAPDVQFLVAPAFITRNGLGDATGRAFSLGVSLVRPQSRGRVTLQSADFTDDPVIDPQYLSHESEVATIVAGIEKAKQIASTAPLSEYRGDLIWPLDGEERSLADHVRENAESYYHPVGTCKMGSDDMAVVDDHLRVHGTEDLRVVDASVMPTITSANTNATTLMIAERAADLIAGGE